VHPPDDVWEDGSYAVDVAFDHANYSCRFTMPDAVDFATQNAGVPIPIDCAPALEASLDAVVPLITHSDGRWITQTFTPIPGHHYLSVRTPALAAFWVAVTLDGTPYFEDSSKLYYTVNQPNGPDCEPTCRNALEEFQVPGAPVP
jgi:hypothetical protein